MGVFEMMNDGLSGVRTLKGAATSGSGGQLQEIRQNLFAVFGEDGFGMELDAPDGVLFVAEAHDLAFGFGFGGDLEGVGQRVAFDEERVVAGGGEGIGHAFEKVAAIVIDGRGFAVHEAVGADDFAAEDVAHTLVAEADAKHGDGGAEGLDDVVGEAGFARRTGAGRNEDAGRFQGADLVESDLVIAGNLHLHAQLAEVLHEVVREAVVIVDDQQHARDGTTSRSADQVKRRSAFALATLSLVVQCTEP